MTCRHGSFMVSTGASSRVVAFHSQHKRTLISSRRIQCLGGDHDGQSPVHVTERERCVQQPIDVDDISALPKYSRRGLMMGCALALLSGGPSHAVQGLTAGRIPGVTGPESNGLYRYTRPEGKSGGHGVGWSEIPRYTFQVPEGWEEKPVSIADLGGTEIDLRFENPDQGNLLVIVAPVLRFMDVGYNASVDIEQIGPPDTIIAGFAPELYGKPLMEDDVIETAVVHDGGLTYYQWQVKPHHVVSATAVGNRVFILSTTSNSRQWRRAKDDLVHVQRSFRVLR